jgi:hypothetical protein
VARARPSADQRTNYVLTTVWLSRLRSPPLPSAPASPPPSPREKWRSGESQPTQRNATQRKPTANDLEFRFPDPPQPRLVSNSKMLQEGRQPGPPVRNADNGYVVITRNPRCWDGRPGASSEQTHMSRKFEGCRPRTSGRTRRGKKNKAVRGRGYIELITLPSLIEIFQQPHHHHHHPPCTHPNIQSGAVGELFDARGTRSQTRISQAFFDPALAGYGCCWNVYFRLGAE